MEQGQVQQEQYMEYDMSGGAWEYVMGNYNDVIGESGF